jgi:hypothetical protein
MPRGGSSGAGITCAVNHYEHRLIATLDLIVELPLIGLEDELHAFAFFARWFDGNRISLLFQNGQHLEYRPISFVPVSEFVRTAAWKDHATSACLKHPLRIIHKL